MDKVVHFEIPADDLERAQKFYNSVFGWKMDAMPEMIEDAMKNVKKMGGKMVREKMQVGDMGYASYFKDTEGKSGCS